MFRNLGILVEKEVYLCASSISENKIESRSVKFPRNILNLPSLISLQLFGFCHMNSDWIAEISRMGRCVTYDYQQMNSRMQSNDLCSSIGCIATNIDNRRQNSITSTSCDNVLLLRLKLAERSLVQFQRIRYNLSRCRCKPLSQSHIY